MKTNSIAELLKAKGVKVEPKPTVKASSEAPGAPKPKRTRLYHFDEPKTETPLQKASEGVKEPLPTVIAPVSTNRTEGLDSKSPAIGQQKTSKATAIREQLDSTTTANKTAVGVDKIELDSKSTAESPATRQQLDSKSRHFFEVVGKEREFLIFVFNQMVFQGGNSTRPISTDELKTNFGLSAKRLANIVERLVLKGALIIEKGQRGRASWRVFSLPKKIYQEIRSELGSQKPIRQQLDSIKTAESPAESPADPSRSSSISFNSSFKNSNTTTTDNLDSWLTVPEILGKVPLKQLREASREGGMSHEELQQSLEHFAFDLANGKVNSRTPNKIAILVGSLKKGGYFSQECLSQLDQAIQQVQQRREAIKQQQADAETAKLKLEFQEWIEANPDDFEELKRSIPFLSDKSNPSPMMLDYIVFPKWVEQVKLKNPNDLGI